MYVFIYAYIYIAIVIFIEKSVVNVYHLTPILISSLLSNHFLCVDRSQLFKPVPLLFTQWQIWLFTIQELASWQE